MIPEKLVNKYIDEYNKNHNTGVRELKELSALAYEYGSKNGIGGIVFGSKRNKQGKLMIYQTEQQEHVLINAGTGYGKTQGYILNTIMNLDGKSSAIIVDPKGEICSLTYNYLAKLYGAENVGILNFRAPQNTQFRYNPFQSLAEKYYDTRKMPKAEKEAEREKIIANLQILISNMFPIRTAHSDPTWDIGARELILAFVIGLIEDTCEDSFNAYRKSELRRVILPNEVTIGAVIKIFSRFSWQAESGTWGDLGFFYSRPDKSIAKQHAKTVLGTSAPGTRTSYLSLVNSYLEPYYNPKIIDITSQNTVDILSMAHKTKVLFLVYDMTDEHSKKLVNDLIVNGLTLLTEEYCKTSQPLKVPVIFLCDEFNSLSPHDIYPNILSVGRGMNIFLHLVVQSIAQLRSSYKEKSDVIIENCGVKLFLGSNDYSTAKNYVDGIGFSVQLSKRDLMSGKILYVEQPRINTDKILYQMERGECFVTMKQSLPVHSFYEMFYNTPEYYVFPKFDITSVVAPKIDKHIDSSQDDDTEEMRIKEAREMLEKRRAEILKKIRQDIGYEEDLDDEYDSI